MENKGNSQDKSSKKSDEDIMRQIKKFTEHGDDAVVRKMKNGELKVLRLTYSAS